MIQKFFRHFFRVTTVALFISFLVSPISAMALSDTFTQKILPLDCVFTVVNAGTGELYYVTPKACGVIVPPNKKALNSQQLSSSQANNNELVPFQYQAMASARQTGGSAPINLPYSPIATISPNSVVAAGGSNNKNSKTGTYVATAAVSGSIILVVAVLFFLF